MPIFKKKQPKTKTKPPIDPSQYSPTNITLTSRQDDLDTADLVLTKEISGHLRECLPILYKESTHWYLTHSISQHGTSLHQMVENNQQEVGPRVLAIKDDNNNVFGAYLSEPLQFQKKFYGNGTW